MTALAITASGLRLCFTCSQFVPAQFFRDECPVRRALVPLVDSINLTLGGPAKEAR